jgi:tetratricopeptide (TPR) repeat protein
MDATTTTAPRRRETTLAEAAIEQRFQGAYAVGDRRQCLRVALELHRLLRHAGLPWARAAARVWLTALAADQGATARVHRRARAASAALLWSNRWDWACRALAQEGRLAMANEDWVCARERLSVACELGLRAKDSIPPAAWTALWGRLGHVHWCLGELSEAREAWQTALEAAEAAGLDETVAACHASLGLCLWTQGEPAAGYVHSSTALNWYRAQRRATHVAQTLYNAALMLEDFGHWRDATILLCEARDTALGAGDHACVGDTSIELAHAFVALGRLQEARQELQAARAAVAAADAVGPPNPRRQADLCIAEAHIRLAQRRVDGALSLLRGARSLVASTNRPLLTRRVARHLTLAAQAGGGRLKTVAETVAIIQALAPREPGGPQSLIVRAGVGEAYVTESAQVG